MGEKVLERHIIISHLGKIHLNLMSTIIVVLGRIDYDWLLKTICLIHSFT